MLRVKSEALKENVEKHGLAKTSDETGVSVHTLIKMTGGNYDSEPNATTRKALCRFFKVSEQDLFENVVKVG